MRRAAYGLAPLLLAGLLLAGAAQSPPVEPRASGQVYGTVGADHQPANAAKAKDSPPNGAAPPGLITEPEDLRHPAAQVLAAYHDVLRVPADRRRYARYVDLRAFRLLERPEKVLAWSGHANLLSRRPVVLRPAAVPGTQLSLLRVQLDDYGVDPAVWDRLARAEVVYRRVTKVAYEYPDPSNAYAARYRDHHGERQYRADDGQYYRVGTYYREAFADPPELTPTDEHAAALAGLHRETHSDLPLVTGRVAFSHTAAQQDRDPGYYGIFGLKDRQDYERLIGFDARLAGSVLRWAVGQSGVTLEARAGVVKPAAYGDYHLSLDFRRAAGGANPLLVTGPAVEDAARAFEAFGLLPNGMAATAIFDAKGVLQAAAPDFIASDHHRSRNDARVHANVSCVRCHAEGGLRPVSDWFRQLYGRGAAHPLKIDRAFREEYLAPLDPRFDAWRARYAAAVHEATGWDVPTFARRYGELWAWGEDLAVDIAQAERETGHARDVLRTAVRRALAHGEQDTVLEALLHDGLAIPARQWDDRYATLQDYLRRFYP